MIANYGYQDGSGTYYIRIDTDCCVQCVEKPCITACSQGLFERIVDDYEEEVVQVVEPKRRSLGSECSACKPASGYSHLPCTRVCPLAALSHSW